MRRVAPDVLLRTERLTLRRFTPADADALTTARRMALTPKA